MLHKWINKLSFLHRLHVNTVRHWFRSLVSDCLSVTSSIASYFPEGENGIDVYLDAGVGCGDFSCIWMVKVVTKLTYSVFCQNCGSEKGSSLLNLLVFADNLNNLVPQTLRRRGAFLYAKDSGFKWKSQFRFLLTGIFGITSGGGPLYSVGIFRPKFALPFLTNQFFELIRELGRGIKSGAQEPFLLVGSV